MVVITASNTIQYSSDGYGYIYVPTTSYKQIDSGNLKSFTMASAYTGSWRITFYLEEPDSLGSVYGRVYKNGVAYGNEFTTATSGTFTQDFTSINIAAGDVITIWGRVGTGDDLRVANFRIMFDAPTGSAYFTSSPSGARIWIDDIDTGYNTPSTVPNVAAGTRNWTLKKSGYADVSGTCVVPTGGTVTVPLVTFLASASFTSSPTTARIWLDGVDKGIDTPGTVTGVTAGSRNFTLKKATYLDYNSSFTATAGTTTTVPLATLTPSATTSVIIID